MFTRKYSAGLYFTPRFWAPDGTEDSSHFNQLTSLATAKSLGPMPAIVNYVMVQAEGQNVHYRDDGGVPTSSTGFILYVGDPPTKFAGSLQLLRFIEGASGGILNVRFY